MRLVLDRFSMEAFFEDGAYAMTATLPTELSSDGIFFTTNEDVVMNITKFDLI